MIEEQRNKIETAKSELHEELSSAQQARAALDQRLDETTAKALALTTRNDAQAKEIEELKTSTTELENTAESAMALDEEVTKLKAELLSSQEKGVRLQQRLDDETKAREAALEKMNKAHANAAMAANALSKMKESLNNEQTRGNELDQCCRKTACERDAAVASQADNEEKMAQARVDRGKPWEEIRTMRKGREDAATRRKKLEDVLAESQKLGQSLRSENEELTAELREARDTVDSIRKFTERVRTTEIAKKGTLKPK